MVVVVVVVAVVVVVLVVLVEVFVGRRSLYEVCDVASDVLNPRSSRAPQLQTDIDLFCLGLSCAIDPLRLTLLCHQ